jgi:DNA replication protein DnaC
MTLPFDPETLDLEPLLKRLHLAYARREWANLCDRAETEAWSPRKLLATLFSEEIAQRHNTRLNREVRRCGFPFLRTVDEFDFSLQSAIRLSLLGSYLGPELVSEGRSLILCGKTGRGKTHLAIAIAYKAIQNGFTARFASAAELISELSEAMRGGGFREVLATYTQPHVLVVDSCAVPGYVESGALSRTSAGPSPA